jgi:hypothetical protein
MFMRDDVGSIRATFVPDATTADTLDFDAYVIANTKTLEFDIMPGQMARLTELRGAQEINWARLPSGDWSKRFLPSPKESVQVQVRSEHGNWAFAELKLSGRNAAHKSVGGLPSSDISVKAGELPYGLKRFKLYVVQSKTSGIDMFMEQFKPETYGKQLRFWCLGLFGSSRSDKPCKALSLYGPEATLKVSCQGLPVGVIPSLSRFDRQVHKCICWDEIRTDQVLGNKEVFQSGPWIVALGQSVCNQHAYEVWLYQIAHILCSNHFPMTQAQGLTEEYADWLQKNLYVAILPQRERWYFG